MKSSIFEQGLSFITRCLFIYLLNFNYTDRNIQIVDKLTIK